MVREKERGKESRDERGREKVKWEGRRGEERRGENQNRRYITFYLPLEKSSGC